MMKTCDKKDIFYIHKTNRLLMIISIFFVFLISIAYSALNASLMVTGDLVYRAEGDIRITGVRINGVTNDGVEQYSPKYGKDTVALGMKLPNLDSTVTYEVTIKNSSSNKYKILNIKEGIPKNTNIRYTHNYTNTTIEANTTIKVLLTYRYSSDVITVPEGSYEETKIVFIFGEPTLYGKMKSDYESGGNVELYTGDKSTFIGEKEVYYYKGETLNNNVIFAGFCWKMYRTTETGGVKMMYNGVPSSGQCTNTGSNSAIGNSAFNTNYNSPGDVGYMYNKRYVFNSKSLSSIPSYLYGNSFTYSGGTYTLTNTQSVVLSSSTISSLASKHYTCFNTSGTCTTLSYVYYVSTSTVYYFNLTGGTNIEQALDEMLYGDNVNTINSAIKTTVDTWYKNNMTGYTSYLEDTIWCNDRSRENPTKDGWNPNGGSVASWVHFKSHVNTTNLTCQNKNDRFTVSSTNGNGKLTYPVGLVTSQETILTTYSNNSPIQNGAYFWTLSPWSFDNGYRAYAYRVVLNGDYSFRYVITSYGTQPAVSLKAGIEYSSGDGTTENPFQIIAPSEYSLYEKVKSDYKSGKAELYTGDKSTFLGNKEVYYYKGETTNNNVIFAGFCWKMFRTTETGGVKMIYNGVPSSGQCTSTGSNSTIGNSAFNTNYTSPADAGYMYNKRYTRTSISVSSSYLYGNSFTYSGGTYTLTNTQSITLSSSTVSSLSNNHYTCWNTTGTCTTLSYVYYVSSSDVLYVNLTGGTSIEQALNEMLYDDNVNTTNSTIKTKIDTWYQNNMTGYTSYLEDTIWCNDRSMNNQSINGWNPNGGGMTERLFFKSEGNTNNLTCQNKNDRFTVSSTNGNGKLTYPVGLVTWQERTLAYYSSNSPIQNGASFWTLSPRYFDYAHEVGFSVYSDGGWNHDAVFHSIGIRPTVSLKADIEYSSGNGTSANPFVISTS